ncbi:signal recognition particle protein [Candidatus Palauibacter sp.]|uniref:signal recognition particle protein n=1 Tax=Candidatus Palauibacter sp. TaxID=3101350 RepID=UPI003AF208E7
MFERLGDRLDGVLKRFRQRGVITEKMLDEGLREVRRALLEADVNFRVARDFLERVRTRALGEDVLKSVRPGDQIVKIVHDELVALLGEAVPEPFEASVPPTVIMLVGLQGSGKTTTAAKLGRRLAKEGRGRRPALVACDPYRPAAADQLEALAGRVGVPLLARPSGTDMAELASGALDEARRGGVTHLLLDMAGRLQADEALMDELRRVKAAVGPHEVLLVADGMTGQEAVRIAEGFHAAVGLTGVVLTKMDGDARGGAALSIYGVLGVPIRFVGTGERPEDLTLFDPERMAGRILQMGDIVGLVERARQTVDLGETERLQKKLLARKGEFDLEDFLVSIQQIQKMGPLKGLLKMMPGIDARMLDQADVDPRRVRHLEAIILSMTPEERRRPQILDGSRRKRVAKGSGRPLQEVNRLLKQFREMRKMMKQMGKLMPHMQGGGGPGDFGRLIG